MTAPGGSRLFLITFGDYHEPHRSRGRFVVTSALLTQALDYVFKDEGGYAERPTEGGGAVNMGITFTVFSAWRQLAGKPKPTFADLKAMSRDEAIAIYAAQFAAPIQFDKLAPGIGYVVLDSCINNGVGGATRFVQEVVHEKVDGHLGAVTLWALRHRDPVTFVNAFCDVRLATEKTFKNYSVRVHPLNPLSKTFGQVWDRRVEDVRGRALTIIAGAKA